MQVKYWFDMPIVCLRFAPKYCHIKWKQSQIELGSNFAIKKWGFYEKESTCFVFDSITYAYDADTCGL